MEEFLTKFFPDVARQMHKSMHETAYCKFDNQLLQLFTSSLYLAALASSFAASMITRKKGRKVSMFIGGLAFLIGALINAFAMNVAMLIIGRLLLGVGVGFANQVAYESLRRMHIKSFVYLAYYPLQLILLVIFCSLLRSISLKWLRQRSEEHSTSVFRWLLRLEFWWRTLSTMEHLRWLSMDGGCRWVWLLFLLLSW